MTTPLPNNRNVEKLPNQANRGLYFDKFFNQWAGGFAKVLEPTKGFDGGKAVWITNFSGTIPETDAASRIAELVKGTGETRNLTTTGPFITGMGLSNPIENGFLWHHTLGVPYLPGSSIKGMMRAWLTQWCEEPGIADGLLGRDDKHDDGGSAGSLIVFDALPVGEVHLDAEVITPHTGDWRITDTPEASPPADWISPVPIPFLVVKEGTEFQFALALRNDKAACSLSDTFGYLEEALEWIGAGAKTAVGFGRFISDEAAEKQRIVERQEKTLAQKAAVEAEQNWQPVAGDRVHWPDGGEDVTVNSVKGRNANVVFDDGLDDTVPLSDLKKIK